MQSVIMLSFEAGIVYSFRLISSTGNQLKPGHVGSEKMSQLVAQLNLSEKGKKKKFLNSKDKSKEKYFFWKFEPKSLKIYFVRMFQVLRKWSSFELFLIETWKEILPRLPTLLLFPDLFVRVRDLFKIWLEAISSFIKYFNFLKMFQIQ